MRNVLIFLVLLTIAAGVSGCRRSTTGHTPWVVPATGDLVDQGDPMVERILNAIDFNDLTVHEDGFSFDLPDFIAIYVKQIIPEYNQVCELSCLN